jgi:hypothetical protein
LINSWRAKVFAFGQHRRNTIYVGSYSPFAAPMVGASPDNIGAQRLAEGGVPASGAGSAKMDAKKLESKNWNLTPITPQGRAQTIMCAGV